jgi:hypothetical protein
MEVKEEEEKKGECKKRTKIKFSINSTSLEERFFFRVHMNEIPEC